MINQTTESLDRLVKQAQFSYDFRHKALPDYSCRLHWRRENGMNDFPGYFPSSLKVETGLLHQMIKLKKENHPHEQLTLKLQTN